MERLENLIAVTGGIGSGKSVVCRILGAKGYNVYDCDSRARRLMESDPGIKERLCTEITPAAVTPDGLLARKAIADVVFDSPEKLARLNAIVHGAVLSDIVRWYGVHAREGLPLFVETAILYQSGLDRMVTEVWEVTAPDEVRIRRAVLRDSAPAEAIEARIRSQRVQPEHPHENVHLIVNDDVTPVLLAVNALLACRR